MTTMRAVLLVILWMLCLVAVDQVQAAITPGSGWQVDSFGATVPAESTKTGACEAALAYGNSNQWSGGNKVCRQDLGDCVRDELGTYGSCSFCDAGNPNCGASDTVYALSPGSTCPANSTLNGGTCECNAGFTESGGACVPTNNCVSGERYTGYFTGTTGGGVVCAGGCEAVVEKSSNQYKLDGTQVVAGTWVKSGNLCSGSETVATAGTVDKALCPTGQCYGTVNGVAQCLPCSDSTAKVEVTTTKTTAADGTVTEKQTTTTTGSAGSSSSTTTTVTPSGGSPTTTTESTEVAKPTEDPNPFCLDNPDSPMCKSGSWSGSCPTFTCDGDAVQCAQAQADWIQACEIQATTAAKTLGDQIVAGSDPAAGTLPDPASPEVVAVPGVSTGGGWLSRTCPSDVSFSIWGGKTFVLPFASLCTYFEMAGAAMLIVAAIVCARIVGVSGG